MRAIRRFTVRTVLPEPLAPLAELASNLRWSWHQPTLELFASLSPARWEAARRDPVAMLGSFSPEELQALAADEEFVARVREASDVLHTYLTEPRWYQTLAQELAAENREPAPRSIAYFSPEFGITAVLPQYSGGLGILAGDHLKSASDLGVPIVGVGLLYQRGYFEQSLTRDGWQHEDYPVLDPHELPISLLREPDGSPAEVTVTLAGGRPLVAHVWKAQVGRVPLLLLDSDHEANDEAARAVTDRLYGGTPEHRLHQEILLGVGGVRALRLWSRLSGAPAPEVYHTNEGHAGFLGLERISELVGTGLSFDEALESVRSATVFTTHTPVPAGIDRFARELIMSHFGPEAGLPGLDVERVLAIGAESYEGGDPSVFNMAVMGLRLAQRANGVSQLHGVVSREMFDGLWPGFDPPEVPITSITNGVHAPTWVDHRMIELAEKHIGPQIRTEARAWEEIAKVPDAQLWATRRDLRADLVTEARQRVRASWLKRGASNAELHWIDGILDPDVLTVGFARRVPTYKRLTLMLRDPERLKRLLLHPERPVQLVIAGKSHPADETGKRLIQQMVRFADEAEVRHRIVFLPNYDIAMAQSLYPGCDVWLNNPLRPFEACGTSGMKSALNGGLNLSVLDGWWDEWFDGENGWAIPTADGVEDPNYRDDLEAAGLYDLLENEVAPRFYDRDAEGLPQRWLSMVRHTFSSLGPKVLASRMVADYVRQLYLPAANAGRATTPERARDLAAFKSRVRASWPGVRVEHVDSSGLSDSPQVGDEMSVRAVISLDGLTADDVEVQVVHGRVSPEDRITDFVVQDLLYSGPADNDPADGRHVFEGRLKLRRTGPFGYTVRVLPKHEGLVAPAELGLVTNA
ncbi:alpha-glucan family phosphorylase [Kineosporia sp. NBRC 101731]|uniref:alpha-glucan family phosphorylase n=1 Tax=Kineosporia sp. NBRC 101731 TaxID=3032199 RepID=UPI00249FEEEB|nr:alpha-glucan family phosphorylase [Kineosporia sp. NBRC 101731]GLY30062.1 alpha-1,4 glucan phosphorylase [Kineosporia sp. NBRC 101731]